MAGHVTASSRALCGVTGTRPGSVTSSLRHRSSAPRASASASTTDTSSSKTGNKMDTVRHRCRKRFWHRTIGRAFGTLCRLSVVCRLYVTF